MNKCLVEPASRAIDTVLKVVECTEDMIHKTEGQVKESSKSERLGVLIPKRKFSRSRWLIDPVVSYDKRRHDHTDGVANLLHECHSKLRSGRHVRSRSPSLTFQLLSKFFFCSNRTQTTFTACLTQLCYFHLWRPKRHLVAFRLLEARFVGRF